MKSRKLLSIVSGLLFIAFGILMFLGHRRYIQLYDFPYEVGNWVAVEGQLNNVSEQSKRVRARRGRRRTTIYEYVCTYTADYSGSIVTAHDSYRFKSDIPDTRTLYVEINDDGGIGRCCVERNSDLKYLPYVWSIVILAGLLTIVDARKQI